MFKKYNPNPYAARVGDCAVRAMSKALDQEWEKSYIDLCLYGLLRGDLPSANEVWGLYLHNNGFAKKVPPYHCKRCYTVKDFCEDHKQGTFVVALNGHVICVKDGDYYDTWDSGDEVPLYYWEKEE